MTVTTAQQATTPEKINLGRLLVKALLMFVVFNLLYYIVQPLNWLNRVTVYNSLYPGRTRLGFADFPAESYNLSMDSLDQLFAAHVIVQPKAVDEYRVVMIGDSGVWGYLLPAARTQAACLNQQGLRLPDGRRVHVYNLGYPKLTVVKDVLILQRALAYQPDLILWPITLASLYPADQMDFTLLKANRDQVAALQARFNLKLIGWPYAEAGLQERTLFGQRRALADWLRFQLYAPNWSATGNDHQLSKFVLPNPTNFTDDPNPKSVIPLSLIAAGKIQPEDLSFDVVKAGVQLAQQASVPIVLINEPIYRSEHPIRYNDYYPRWAFDSYRESFNIVAQREGWRYVDYWDAAPPAAFTDTAFHLNTEANCTYSQRLGELILNLPSPATS